MHNALVKGDGVSDGCTDGWTDGWTGLIRTAMPSVHPSILPTVCLLAVLFAVGPSPATLHAQGIPTLADAELVFEQGLEAYETQDYAYAARRFRLVAFDYPLHSLTTAALLMRGKALYLNGEYERARLALETLSEEYPSSSYVDEARTIAFYAEEQIDRTAGQEEVLDLGILLPFAESGIALTQSMFDGIHLAVREFNNTGERPVRMVFQAVDETDSPEGAVQALIAKDVDLIIGPLFSEEARRAAAAAESAGVLLMAPLATDEDVSAGRTWVFQANPTIAMRGRLMAGFAHGGLRIDTVGVVYEAGNDLSARMAESFIQSAQGEGITIALTQRLSTAGDWYELGSYVGPGQLDSLEALYLPIAGQDAGAYISAALNSLDRVGAEIRVLGNSEWHHLPIPVRAGQFDATYTNDFYPDPASASAMGFEERYEELTGRSPDRLGYTGYDLTRYLLSLLKVAPESPLYEVLRGAPPYEGLGLRFNFSDGNVNRGLYYLRYRFGNIERLR